MKKVTEKNTKSDILSAYREAIKKYNELAKAKVPVTKQVEEKEKEDFYDKVEAKSDFSLTSITSSFVKRAEDLDKGMQEIQEQYKMLSEAIDSKKEELEDLYGLESGCHSLIALAEARKEESLKHKEKMQAEEDAFAAKKRHYEEMLKDLDSVYEKKVEELKYDFERRMKDQKFNSELLLKKQKAQIEDEMKVWESAKKEFQDEQEAFKVIKDEFEENSKEIIAKEKENSKRAIEAVKRALESDKVIMEARYEAELSKKSFEIELLMKKVSDIQQENSTQAGNLREAYLKLQDLARETVHSKGKDEIIDKLSSMAKRQNSGS